MLKDISNDILQYFMSEKRVYTFGNGKAEGRADMRNLLGGKGANLAEMNLIGVPVPPGLRLQQMYATSISRKERTTSSPCCATMWRTASDILKTLLA